MMKAGAKTQVCSDFQVPGAKAGERRVHYGGCTICREQLQATAVFLTWPSGEVSSTFNNVLT